MDGREIFYWTHLFPFPEEPEEGQRTDAEEEHDSLEGRLTKIYGFSKGKITVPALKLEVELERDEFYRFMEVEDPHETADFINSQLDGTQYHPAEEACGEDRFYWNIIYRWQGGNTNLDLLLLRRGLKGRARKREEALLAADFLYIAKKVNLLYACYDISREQQEKIKSIGDFENFCQQLLRKIPA